MKKRLLSLTQTVLFALAMMGCSSSPKEEPRKASEPTTSVEARQVGIEQESPYVAEIKFAKGSDELQPQAQSQLRKLMKKAEAAGEIETITLVSWADSEYPASARADSNESAPQLANRRNQALREFFESDESRIEISEINMAESPSRLESWLKSDESQIKRRLVEAGIPTAAQPDKDTPKASHAIVMINVNAEDNEEGRSSVR